LHGARTGARDRQGKDAAIILWTNAAPGILRKSQVSLELANFSMEVMSIALTNMLAPPAQSE
jgi:hypothetical protein